VASTRDDNGFVMDFGKLKALKEGLDTWFDHTLVLNNNDPLREEFKLFLDAHGLNNIVLVPDCSCEGIAAFVFAMANAMVTKETEERVRVRSVVVYEDSKNSACYAPFVP
jgi:6-pyruvoyltetrahydropterin/6-carboxytetrahydropterin synthase